MIAPKLIIPAAVILPALFACAELDQRDQALRAFADAQDAARDQLTLFQREPRGSCGSEHLAQASAGAEANLALLDFSRPIDPARPIDPSVVAFVETTYGSRPVSDTASLTIDIAKSAANAGCPDQARVLYRYVIDRYVRSDYADYRQRAEVGLAELGGP